MPVAQGGPPPARQALVVGLGAALGVVAILFLVLQADRLIGGTDLDISIGDGIFKPGPVEDLAAGIAEDGPLLLSDPAGGDRDLVLNHTGDDADDGWHVFAARPPTSPRDCFVQWEPGSDRFVDSCDGSEYPASGEGLPQYPVSIDADGVLSIDLNATPRIADGEPAGGDRSDGETGGDNADQDEPG